MLASLVDSCLDLLSGLVLFLTRRSMDRKEYYNYPQARLSVCPSVCLSVCVSVGRSFSVRQLVSQSVSLSRS